MITQRKEREVVVGAPRGSRDYDWVIEAVCAFDPSICARLVELEDGVIAVCSRGSKLFSTRVEGVLQVDVPHISGLKLPVPFSVNLGSDDGRRDFVRGILSGLGAIESLNHNLFAKMLGFPFTQTDEGDD